MTVSTSDLPDVTSGTCVRAARLFAYSLKSVGLDAAVTGENLADTAHDIVPHSFPIILSLPNLLFLPELL